MKYDHFEEKFATMTEEQIRRVLNGERKDHFMRYGRNVTEHIDSSMTRMHLYTIEGVDGVFPSDEAATEKCKELFIKDAAKLAHDGVYTVSHYSIEHGRNFYTEGLRGIGQQFGWWSTPNVVEAKWFYSLEDVMAYIKRRIYDGEGATVEVVPVRSLYYKATGKCLGSWREEQQ